MNKSIIAGLMLAFTTLLSGCFQDSWKGKEAYVQAQVQTCVDTATLAMMGGMPATIAVPYCSCFMDEIKKNYDYEEYLALEARMALNDPGGTEAISKHIGVCAARHIPQ